jgi:hypothetical protein
MRGTSTSVRSPVIDPGGVVGVQSRRLIELHDGLRWLEVFDELIVISFTGEVAGSTQRLT